MLQKTVTDLDADESSIINVVDAAQAHIKSETIKKCSCNVVLVTKTINAVNK